MTETDEVRAIRLLRHALAAIRTALESDGDTDQAAADAQRICDEGLNLTTAYCRPGKDLTDDTRGLESWRRHVAPGGEVVRPVW